MIKEDIILYPYHPRLDVTAAKNHKGKLIYLRFTRTYTNTYSHIILFSCVAARLLLPLFSIVSCHFLFVCLSLSLSLSLSHPPTPTHTRSPSINVLPMPPFPFFFSPSQTHANTHSLPITISFFH